MGSVWLAEHLSLHSPVAIKLIAGNVAHTAEGLQRFLREARMAASLRSPHIVQVLDYGVHQDVPYIAMELLDGESLAQRLTRVRRLGSSQTELVLRHVGRAVTRAHELGIVHRDLKPGNIFIVRNEDEELIKLLDFGLAKHTLAELSASIASNTRTGAFVGTPFYASPEQARGSKTLDHRADIWSIGVIAFECLVGQHPFVADTFSSLLLAICSQPMPVPSERGPVPAGFDAWFARACARAPEARFQSAREAVAELRRVLEPGAVDIALVRTRTGLMAPPEVPQPEDPWPPPAGLGVTTGAASSPPVSRRWLGGLNVNVARFAGGAVFVALTTALWIAWSSGHTGRGEGLDTSAEAGLGEPARRAGVATPSTAAVAPPAVAPPAVAPSGVAAAAVPPSSAAPMAAAPSVVVVTPQVAPVADWAPQQEQRSGPAQAGKPRSKGKIAAAHTARGSKTSAPPAASQASSSKASGPNAAQSDIALTPAAPKAKGEAAPAKHNLGF